MGDPCLTTSGKQPSDDSGTAGFRTSTESGVSRNELAWREKYRAWAATPDGPLEHAARAELAEARRALTWEEREGLWERFLAADGSG